MASFMMTSFKKELLQAVHNFTASTGHTFKMALYDATGVAAFAASATVYSATNEITNTSGTAYTAGGFTLTCVTPTTSGTTALTTFSPDPNWTTATFTAYGATIYNSSASNKLVCQLDFGGAKPVSSGTFTVVMPTADASNAIIRIA